MANTTAPAANSNDQVIEDPNKKGPVTDGQQDATKPAEEDKPDAITQAASDAWTDVSSFISWGVNKATDVAKGAAALVVPNCVFRSKLGGEIGRTWAMKSEQSGRLGINTDAYRSDMRR